MRRPQHEFGEGPLCRWVSPSEARAEAHEEAFHQRIELGNRCVTEDYIDGYTPPWTD